MPVFLGGDIKGAGKQFRVGLGVTRDLLRRHVIKAREFSLQVS